MATKITALTTAASAQATQTYVIVSGTTNKQITASVAQRFTTYVQEATAVATATVARLPSNSDIFSIYVKVPIGSSGGAAGSLVNVGLAGNASYFGSITTSGAGLYYLQNQNVSAARLVNTSGEVVAAAPSATAASVFVVGIEYVKR